MITSEANKSSTLEAMRARLRSQLKELTGLDDTSGVELLRLVRGLAQLFELAEAQLPGGAELSGPRWGVLMHLMAQEQLGDLPGPTPTSLSRFEGVSKNTTSSLLRGLEEQGYVERALDPRDYRVFRIQLTPAGRELVKSTAPGRFACLNRLASGLSREEREQLSGLLHKLFHSIKANAQLPEEPNQP
jgi:DNA-binding MarR family transcriptional regulator